MATSATVTTNVGNQSFTAILNRMGVYLFV
jgi:hypothetical protein